MEITHGTPALFSPALTAGHCQTLLANPETGAIICNHTKPKGNTMSEEEKLKRSVKQKGTKKKEGHSSNVANAVKGNISISLPVALSPTAKHQSTGILISVLPILKTIAGELNDSKNISGM